ncbi:MAG: hypothetical protein COA78_04315 [Blastopirellula sp.]|nr:MAG: hypothetical protein COA78_04315 [Blastopirellula sp.]
MRVNLISLGSEGPPTPRLYDSLVEVYRVRHYSSRTEEAYIHWIQRYTEFHSRFLSYSFLAKENDMISRTVTHFRFWLLAVIVTAGSSDSLLAETTTVYVVRHAEKEQQTLNELIETLLDSELADQTRPLTPQGMQRALDLRDLLRFEGVKLDVLYSTHFLRTWQTAAPCLDLIKSQGPKKVWRYTAIDDLANKISSMHSGKSILVVGHSTQVEKIVERLTGKTVAPIGNQFNNLFVVMTDGTRGTYERRSYGEFTATGTINLSESDSIAIEEAEDISGVAVMKDGSLLIVSDESKNAVQVIKKDGVTYVAQRPLRIVENEDDELDLEAVTRQPNSQRYFAVGSHSSRRRQIYKKHASKTDEERRERFEDKSPDRESHREQIFRFEIDDEGQLKNVESKDLQNAIRSHKLLSHFFNRKINDEKDDAIPSKENGIDIEGIAWHDDKLYIGLRGPVLRWNFVPVMIVDFDNLDNANVRYVQLDGRGIRDLVRINNGFLILAGANGDEPLSFQLYFWNGKNCFPGEINKRSPHVVLLGTVPTPPGSKAEGIAVLNLDDQDAKNYELLVIYDGLQGGRPTRYLLPRANR